MPTHPGIHPDFDITQYPDTVGASIRTISRNFYVTRSFRSITIGNSQYWAILIRPTDEFSIYINTDREALVLFATYETFEIRTLEAYDTFYDRTDSSRVDRSVRFLVSSDSKIETHIQRYVEKNPEYPIIIPTTFDSLRENSNHLLAAVRRNYLIRDLFGYQNPLREESFFFGRQKTVNAVLDMAKSGQNSSLFGLRKSGKTSAIYAIQRRARGFGCNVVLIDCQNPSIHARNYADLLAYVVAEVRKVLGQKSNIASLGLNLPEVSDKFFHEMKTILGNAKGTTLLIFDEIENISPKTAASAHWRNGDDTIYFWQVLRSFLQSEAKGRLSICIVGTSPHILEAARINGVDNPIYLYAQKNFIPNLSFDETREMVSRLGYFMGLEFDPSLIATLHKDFGGHPFFTRQVCSKVHQSASSSRPLQVSAAALERAKKEFFGQLESYLRDIISQLKDSYPAEFDVLCSVVAGDREEANEYGREAPDLIDHLIGYGLVKRVGEDFEIGLEVINLALNNLMPKIAIEDRWAEISRRRNVLEANIRVALFHWSKNVDPQDWIRIVESALTEKRRVILGTCEPGLIFSSTDSPLYLLDLMMILKSKEVLPYLGDRRSTLISALNATNKLRKDAHANIVSDEEMQVVRLAFEQLEAEFGMP